MSKQTSAALESDAPKRRPPTPIPLSRVSVLAHRVGEPHQVVLPDDLDPIEVLGDATYWGDLPQKFFAVGQRIELTNDAGSYLFEIWVRNLHGSVQSGVRGVRFFHRIVWDERADTIDAPIVATGAWQVVYRGRNLLWRVIRPNGTDVGTPFNSESDANVYRRQAEGNPKPR